jgi:hypothetical protein
MFSASLRHGMTTDTSGPRSGAESAGEVSIVGASVLMVVSVSPDTGIRANFMRYNAREGGK